MNEKYIEEVIKLTNKSYQTIARQFAQSRQNLWQGIDEVIKKYTQYASKVLDVGCGSGRYYQVFEDKQIHYTGIDISSNLIQQACKKYKLFFDGQSCHNPYLEFQVADARSLPFADDSFDSVLLIAVLNHFPGVENQKQILQDVYRVLKPGGYLIMTNWNMWKLRRKKNVWLTLKDRLFLNPTEWKKKYYFPKKILGMKDIITNWKSSEIKGFLYYYAFTIKELSHIVNAVGFEVLYKAYHNKKGKSFWFNGDNIVIVARK